MFGLAKRKPEEPTELERLSKDPAEDYVRLSPTRPPALFWVGVAVGVFSVVSYFIPGVPKHLSKDTDYIFVFLMVITFFHLLIRGSACFVLNSLVECSLGSIRFRNQTAYTTVKHRDAEFGKGLLLQDSVQSNRNIKLKKFGQGKILLPYGVLLLAELCRRGAAVHVPGFGDELLGVSHAKQTIDPFVRQRALAWGSSAILLIFGIIGSIWISYLPRSYLVPLLIIFVLTSAVAASMVSVWLLESNGSFLHSIQVSDREVTIERFGKQPLHLEFTELKSLEVAAENKGVLGDRISIKAVTHYGRTYVLLNNAKALGFGFLNLLEAAKQKGINIRYLHLQAKEDEPRLALELNPIRVGSAGGAFGDNRTHLDGPNMSKTPAELSEEV
jgi:hypothetical protein